MARQVTKEIRNFIKKEEGEVLTAYQDSAGIWTIGVGHTSDSKLKVTKGLKITAAQSDELLTHDLAEAEDAVSRLVKVPLNDNQFGALVSFTFNLGEGNLKSSTLLKKLNAGDYASVPSELNKWVNAGGKRLQGLVNRRKREGELFNKKSVIVLEPTTPAPTPSVESGFWAILRALIKVLFK